MSRRAVIASLAGPDLGAEDAALLRRLDPAGLILFARNCETPAQLQGLTARLRDCLGWHAPILIDQEGGRVARLRPPAWPQFPAAAAFGRLYARAPLSAMAAARLNARALAAMLREVGVDVDCLPVLDVPAPGAHAIIGDRAYAEDPAWIAALGAATLDGLWDGGVAGVIKHIPGHGRATADSHHELPVVDATADELERDLAPFRALARRSSTTAAMTAHIVYTAWDPARCATLSPVVIGDIIRTRIGFDGLLMSDDLGMQALSGTLEDRVEGALAAGCDVVLHCSGDPDELARLARITPPLAEPAQARLARLRPPPPAGPAPDLAALMRERDALLAMA
jgi:beta-N-acetylhexosaminidase